MKPLRKRMIEDMQLRNFAPATQKNYLHYVTNYAAYFDRSPDELDLEAVREYELYLLNEKKASPESINTFVTAVKFLYLETLEMLTLRQRVMPTLSSDKQSRASSPLVRAASSSHASGGRINCPSSSATRRSFSSSTTSPA